MAGRLGLLTRRQQQLQPISSPLAVPPLMPAPHPAAIARSALYPSDQPIGGVQTLTFNPFTPTKLNPLLQIGFWKTTDQVPRRVTVKVANGLPLNQNTLNPSPIYGLALKVTVGNDRGSIAQWYGAPLLLPTEGTYVRVEATIVSVPYVFTAAGPFSPLGALIPYSITASCVISDESSNQDRPVLLCPPTAATIANGPQVASPCIVDQILLTNTNATAPVLMVVLDGATAVLPTPTQILAAAFVPAQTTVSIGAGLLGSVGRGVCVFGVTNLSSLTLTEDANDANVYAQVYGRILLPGSQ